MKWTIVMSVRRIRCERHLDRYTCVRWKHVKISIYMYNINTYQNDKLYVGIPACNF